MSLILQNIPERTSNAVKHHWSTLGHLSATQSAASRDRGSRLAVTGSKQMDGFCDLARQVLIDSGVSQQAIHTQRGLELPGYFRPTKRWDMVVVLPGSLLGA